MFNIDLFSPSSVVLLNSHVLIRVRVCVKSLLGESTADKHLPA